eukprot:3327064-Rhodomonas_salina.3
MCKAWFRQMALVLFVAYLVTGSLELHRLLGERDYEAKWVRFVSMEQRGSVDGQSSAVVCTDPWSALMCFVLPPRPQPTLRSGWPGTPLTDSRVCGQASVGDVFAERLTDTEWVVELEEKASVDGFFWHTSKDPAAQDPGKFEIQISVDGEEWKMAATFYRILHYSGVSEPEQRVASHSFISHPSIGSLWRCSCFAGSDCVRADGHSIRSGIIGDSIHR